MNLYLGPWNWISNAWHAPIGSVGLLDLRSDATCATPTVASGYGLFAIERSLGADYTLLGTSLNDTIGPIARGLIASRLGVASLSSNRLGTLLEELLTDKCDVGGQTFCKPIRPTSDKRLKIYINGFGDIVNRRFNGAQDTAWSKLREFYIREYASLRLKESDELSRKWLSYIAANLGVDSREISEDSPLRHGTVVSETFNTADSTTLGPLQPWTELSGNWAVDSNNLLSIGTTTHLCRCDTPVSGENHFCTLSMLSVPSGSAAGPICRKDATTAVTFYHARLSAPSTFQLYKFVGGTATLLGSDGVSVSLPQNCMVYANGTDIQAWWNGSQIVSAVDASIATGLYGGARAFSPARFDDYSLEDIGGGEESSIIPLVYRRRRHANT